MCTGYIFKIYCKNSAAIKIYGTQLMAFGGSIFLALQLLSHFDYIIIKWDKLNNDFTSIVGKDEQTIVIFIFIKENKY